MKNVKYKLEIYEPGSAHDLWVAFEAGVPFMKISRGDLLNPGTWQGAMHPDKLARVVSVEHIIFESGGHVTHKLCVFTESTDNSPEVRTG